MQGVLSAVFLASGFSALVFETLWFRQAGLAFGNSIWASSMVLSSFMAGLALGNLLSVRMGVRAKDPLRAYLWLELVIAATGPVLVYQLPQLTPITTAVLGGAESAWWVNPARFALAFVVLTIPATAMGATLPILVDAAARREPTFGTVLGRPVRVEHRGRRARRRGGRGLADRVAGRAGKRLGRGGRQRGGGAGNGRYPTAAARPGSRGRRSRDGRAAWPARRRATARRGVSRRLHPAGARGGLVPAAAAVRRPGQPRVRDHARVRAAWDRGRGPARRSLATGCSASCSPAPRAGASVARGSAPGPCWPPSCCSRLG